MSSSKRAAPPPAAATAASKPGSSYARFIPREELQGFSAWTPGALEEGNTGAQQRRARPQGAAPAKPEVDAAAALQQHLSAARQSGYQDGYRDGMAALEAFKQSFAQQMAAQIGNLVASFDAQLGAMEHELAATINRTATDLARQVVRSELAQRPEVAAQVAHDAVDALLMSARHISVSVHPDDLHLVASGAGEALRARGARLQASPQIARGGCLVESDLGRVDARIETRWAQAAGLLGSDTAWDLVALDPDGEAAA